MSIQMTKEEALKIQAEHIEWYGREGRNGGVDRVREIVTAQTTADALEDGKLYNVIEINEHIPRGAFIEYLLGINPQFND